VELSNLLLDYYCKIIPAAKPDPAEEAFLVSLQIHSTTTTAPNATSETSPLDLYRTAARDRAYGLISSLTRLGSGWDNSTAWFVLARAYEESRQIEKAKEALWWTVELEETTPIREWKSVGLGGYVL
jgi:hypothetical protein